MNLTIDIGNTRIKAGVFNGTVLKAHCIISSHSVKGLRNFVKKYPGIKHAIISSTIDYPKGLKSVFGKKIKVIEVSAKTLLPFKNTYKTPETLGKDRLASVAGAQQMLPGKNTLVINAGTCVTYDFIDSKGTYYGGSISPGLDMRFKALHTFTGRLPLLKANKKFKNLIGKTTRESMLAGVQTGMAEEVQGIITAYKKRYTNLQVVLTGGSLDFLKNTLKEKIITEPFLTLKGLNVILSLNLKGKKPKHS